MFDFGFCVDCLMLGCLFIYTIDCVDVMVLNDEFGVLLNWGLMLFVVFAYFCWWLCFGAWI